jgi:hypothetical protein
MRFRGPGSPGCTAWREEMCSGSRLLGVLAMSALLGCQVYTAQPGVDTAQVEGDPIDVEEDGSVDEVSEDEEEPEDSPLTHRTLSNESIMNLVRSYAYRGPDFVLLNPEPFPSTVAPGKFVSLYVSASAQDTMSEVIPERAGSDAEIPAGTVIVREVLNAGELETITVMVKLPFGAFPLGGDFWYGATDAEGNIKSDSEGMPIAGLLENCGTCHLRRAHDGFLFGTPRAYLP